jgi:hypothetical protein
VVSRGLERWAVRRMSRRSMVGRRTGEGSVGLALADESVLSGVDRLHNLKAVLPFSIH